MISVEDIKLLIHAGEGYNAEFKANIPSKVKELTEEICAFANAAGGTLLVGVNDRNEIVGCKIDNAKRWSIQNSLNEITPKLPCEISIIEIEGNSVGVFEVPSGSQKPYVLSGAIFVRIGPNTQKLTTAEQMRDFFQQTNKLYFDEAPCKEFRITENLDENFISIFKSDARISPIVSDSQLFANLKLYTDENNFKNGAVLFFGKQPEEIIEKAITRCVIYQGKDKRFIADDKIFGGNLFNQY